MDSNEICLRCSRCKLEKPEGQFNRHRTRLTGRHHYCKGCVREARNPKPSVVRRSMSRTPRTLVLTDGHLWCTGCNSEKLVEAFAPNKRHRAGRANWCRACIKKLWQRP